MPLIITDEMVKKECMMSRPIPVQAMGVLKPKRVGNKPNYIRKRGRSGIRPVELPIYAPASVGGLVKSICDISKLDEQVVEKYLENGINNQLAQYNKQQDNKLQDFVMNFPAAEQPDEEVSAAEEPVELFDVETQTRGAGRPPKNEVILDAGVFQSAGDVVVDYPDGTANTNEDTNRPAGRPRDENTIKPRLRGNNNEL